MLYQIQKMILHCVHGKCRRFVEYHSFYNTDAGVIGFWCTKDGTIQNWGSGCLYFVQAVDGSLNIGRYEKIASGTTGKVHCVLASKKDPSKYVEFIVNITFA